MNWEDILAESKQLSPWLDDASTPGPELCRINKHGVPVCEVGTVEIPMGGKTHAGRFMFEEWRFFGSMDEAKAALDEIAKQGGYSL